MAFILSSYSSLLSFQSGEILDVDVLILVPPPSQDPYRLMLANGMTAFCDEVVTPSDLTLGRSYKMITGGAVYLCSVNRRKEKNMEATALRFPCETDENGETACFDVYLGDDLIGYALRLAA